MTCHTLHGRVIHTPLCCSPRVTARGGVERGGVFIPLLDVTRKLSTAYTPTMGAYRAPMHFRQRIESLLDTLLHLYLAR